MQTGSKVDSLNVSLGMQVSIGTCLKFMTSVVTSLKR